MQLESCGPKICKECDLTLIIKDHIHTLMQVLDKDLSEYNFKMIATKCLNTAVMILYMYLGNKALKHTRYCDVQNVRTRYSSKNASVENVIKFKQSILNRHSRYRYLYYVMITDSENLVNSSNERRFFPGHVFIIEKVPSKNGVPKYSIYQSFIEQYTFKQYVDELQKTRYFSYEKMIKLINDMVSFFDKGTWDQEDTKFWQQLTHVDLSNLETCRHTDKILFCARSIKVKTCASKLKGIVNKKIKELKHEDPQSIFNNVYNDYAEDAPKKTKDLLTDLLKLQAKLS